MPEQFRATPFSPGAPLTSTDLNQIIANLKVIYDANEKLKNTVLNSDGSTKQVVSKIASGLRQVKGLGEDSFQEATVNISKYNFQNDPVITVSIAEKLEKSEDVDLYVYDVTGLSFKIGVRIQNKKSGRKTLDVNWIAVAQEDVS